MSAVATTPVRKRGQRAWTEAQRAEQARKFRTRQIWLKSTGPKTEEGKAVSSQNATTHGCYNSEFKQICLWLRMQRRYIQTIVLMNKYDLFEDEKSEETQFKISGNELIDQTPNFSIQSPDFEPKISFADQKTKIAHIIGLSDYPKICYSTDIHPSNRLSTVTDTPKSSPLTSEDVIAYLKSHPDFLTKNPEALDVLNLPKQQNGRKIADFQTYMIERLKADKTEAIETAKEIVETARHNMNNQSRIHRSVLRLLEAESFEEFIESITSDLTTFLDVDITSLVIESDDNKIPHVTLPGIRIVPAGTLDKWMAGKNILHQSDISGVETVYGAGAQLVRSQVLVRVDVSQKTPPAMLAFGSRDPQMFQAGQGTEQVSFLAGVVERCIRSWLHLST